MKPEYGARFMVSLNDSFMCAAFWLGEVGVETIPRARHA